MNEKQRLFCEYYADTLNARQSAIRAGYDKNSAKNTGYKLLKNKTIKNKISQLIVKMPTIPDIEKMELIEEHRIIAFSTHDLEYDSYGDVVLGSLKDIDSRLISEIGTGKKGELKVKFVDRQKSLEYIDRYISIKSLKKIDITKPENVIVALNDLYKNKCFLDEITIKERLLIIDRALKYHQINLDTVSNNNNAENIKAFLEATKPTKKELEEIFNVDESK